MKYAQTTKDRLDESETKKKGMKKKKQTTQDRLDEAEGRKRGKTKTKDQKKKPEMEKVKVKGGTIKFRKGGLHNSLKVPEDYKFTKAQIARYAKKEVGDMINIAGNSIKITKKIMKQIDLAKTLMGFKKDSKPV
tara:strand:+ start:326 stop:727 length:402 start_codon:yes stop_codon:yes gene_type:complete